MKLLSVSEAAQRLAVTPGRVRVLIAGGRLPAEKIGYSYVIQEKDLALVAKRPPGRPAAKKSAKRKK